MSEIDWVHAKQIQASEDEKLLVFLYKNGDGDHPKIIECDRLKVFSKITKENNGDSETIVESLEKVKS